VSLAALAGCSVDGLSTAGSFSSGRESDAAAANGSGAANDFADPPRADGGVGAPTPANPRRGSTLCSVPTAGARCWPDDPGVPSTACLTEVMERFDGGVPPSFDAGAVAEEPGSLACHVRKSASGVTQQCDVPGAGKAGAPCQTADECGSGLDCVGSPGRCRAYCCAYECSDPQTHCGLEALVDGSHTVPVCLPTVPCRLLSNDCGSKRTCTVVTNDGTTSCVDVGGAKAGESCEEQRCEGGLACLGQPGGRRCFRLCRVDDGSSCSRQQRCKGSVQLFNDPNIGVCE
jgi:hypothetical protein